MVWEHLDTENNPPASSSTRSSASRSSTRTATGRLIGKAERRSTARNDARLTEFVEHLETLTTPEAATTYLDKSGIQIARVTRHFGGGRLEVTLQNGKPGVTVTISGSISVKGRASTKTDRAYVISVNDIVLLHGPQVAARLPKSTVRAIQTIYTSLSIATPKGFFSTSVVTEDDDLGFVFEGGPAGGAGKDIEDEDL